MWQLTVSMSVVAALALGTPPKLHEDEVEYYDRFGDSLFGMVYDGGYIDIPCTISVDGSVELVYEKGGVWFSTKAKAKDKVNLLLKINSSTPLGDYVCRNDNKPSDKKFKLFYRLCPTNSKTCVNGLSATQPRFCVVSDNKKPDGVANAGIPHCTRRYNKAIFCPSKSNTLCDAYYSDLRQTLSEYSNGCETNDISARTAYMTFIKNKGHSLLFFNEFFNMKDADQLQVYCGGYKCEDADVEWFFKQIGGAIVKRGKITDFRDRFRIDLTEDLRSNGSQVLKYMVILKKGTEVVRLAAQMVVFGTSLELVKKKDTDGKVRTFDIKIVGSYTDEFFLDACVCVYFDTKELLPIAGMTVHVSKAGKVECVCKNRWKTCNPNMEFMEEQTATVEIDKDEVDTKQVSQCPPTGALPGNCTTASSSRMSPPIWPWSFSFAVVASIIGF